jgi:hypothetical protein
MNTVFVITRVDRYVSATHAPTSVIIASVIFAASSASNMSLTLSNKQAVFSSVTTSPRENVSLFNSGLVSRNRVICLARPTGVCRRCYFTSHRTQRSLTVSAPTVLHILLTPTTAVHRHSTVFSISSESTPCYPRSTSSPCHSYFTVARFLLSPQLYCHYLYFCPLASYTRKEK